jgi:ABC-type amino acid transport substrate-binding protein
MRRIFLYIFFVFFSVSSLAQEQPEKPLHIGVQPRYFPYSHQDDEQMEGILVKAVRSICIDIGRSCVFHAIDFDVLLQALKYQHLDAVIIAEQFITDAEAEGLFFLPPFCKTKPVFIFEEKVDLAITPELFMRKDIGVLAGSYLEYYLQNTLPLNTHIIPYALLENAVFDLLNKKIDILFSSQAFFQRRAKNVFLDDVRYDLPSSAVPLETYDQPIRSMALVIREGATELKKAFSAVVEKENNDYCFNLLPERFIEKSR